MTTLHMDTDSLLQQLQRMLDLSVQMMDIGEEINSAGNGISGALEGGRGYELQTWVGNWYNKNQYKGGEVKGLAQMANAEAEEWLGVDDKFHYDLDDWWTEHIPFIPPPNPQFSWSGFFGKSGAWNKPIDNKNLLEGKLSLWKGSIGSTPDGLIKWGSYDFGAKAGLGDKGPSAGIYGEFNALEIGGEKVWGSEDLAFTGGAKVKVGSVEAFAGMKDGTIGASIGGYLVKAEATGGFNVGGANVGVKVGASVGIEFGIKIGPETEVKFGPFSFGITIGAAKKP